MPHPLSSSQRRGAGFTLIELLTVIAIIGILAAILIPVVGKVRNQARVTTVVSNMRQVGMAIAAYTADNKDLLPGRNGGGSGLQPAVHGVARMNGSGSGNYSDPTTRLGRHIAPYVGVTAASGDVRIPCLSDPLWEAAITGNGGDPTIYWSPTVFVLQKTLFRSKHPGLQAAQISPFGADAGADTTQAPLRYGSFSNQISISRTWAMIQADMLLATRDAVGTVTTGMLNTGVTPAAPVAGSNRVALMFDWSVRQIPAGVDLTRPY